MEISERTERVRGHFMDALRESETERQQAERQSSALWEAYLLCFGSQPQSMKQALADYSRDVEAFTIRDAWRAVKPSWPESSPTVVSFRLSELVRDGVLRRVDRGVYTRVEQHGIEVR
jgi:hypothetical protein